MASPRTLADVLWLVAANGFAVEADRALGACSAVWDDGRLLPYVAKLRHGRMRITRLMGAAAAGNVKRVRALLKAGAATGAVSAHGLCALHYVLRAKWGAAGRFYRTTAVALAAVTP
jgi:hypothetical protein